MPVTLSYPGIYIEELPSSAHTITAAPTSITVFIGYTHPYKTRTPREPVRIFSFSDYEREFGGLYSSKVFDNKVAHAVNQFFLNGGSDAYVVGLQQTLVDASNTVLTYQPKRTFAADGATGIVFRALEPTDGTPMEVRIDNLRSGDVLADIT
ncbi:MAG TPA: hypothetical protein VKD72_31185, partial [Gemmataceae bacterium]|nr:hypothetical protein [Gemmataceae bacterium]